MPFNTAITRQLGIKGMACPELSIQNTHLISFSTRCPRWYAVVCWKLLLSLYLSADIWVPGLAMLN